MQLIGHFIIRLIAIVFGVFIAMLAASIFISFGLFAGSFSDFFSELNWTLNGDPYQMEQTGGLVAFLVIIVGFFSSFYVASLAALPLMIAITIAEYMRWQSMTVNLVLGGVVSLATGLSLFNAQSDGLPSDGTLVILLATGFIGGFFYWLVAGRSAGKWLQLANTKN